MQTEPETSSETDTADRVSAPPMPIPEMVQQHRIYIWSAPAPYAVVVAESRSFLRQS